MAVADTFNRADSTTTLGTADTGETWATTNGTWGISSNKAYCASSPSSDALAAVETGIADGIIQATVTTSTTNQTDMGLLFRYSNASNFMMLLITQTGGSNHFGIYKRVSGGFSNIINTGGGVLANTTYVVKAVFAATTYQVFVDGAVVLATSSATGLESNTKCGMRVGNTDTGGRFDNFSVGAIPFPAGDSFTRADSATALGTSDSGHAWVTASGVYGISSNKAYAVSLSGEAVTYIVTGQADTTYECDVTTSGTNQTDVALVLRAKDASNFNIFEIHQTGGTNNFSFTKKVGGTYTGLATALTGTVTANTTYHLKVVTSGTSYTFYVNGVSLSMSGTYTTGNETGTGYGFRRGGGDAGPRFDNFNVGGYAFAGTGAAGGATLIAFRR